MHAACSGTHVPGTVCWKVSMPYKDPQRRREHHGIYMRAWYRRNKAVHVRFVANRRLKVIEWYEEMKSGLACLRCGESHPACIEFHHRNPAEKEFDISAARRGEFALEKLLTELAKCDALCANCHLKLHWEVRHANRKPRKATGDCAAEVPGVGFEPTTDGL
jgi:hypothetical protein